MNFGEIVLGILLRCAAWQVLPEVQTYALRVGAGQQELDVLYAQDVLLGSPAGAFNVLWEVLRVTKVPLAVVCIGADLLAVCVLRKHSASVWVLLLNPICILSCALSLSCIPAALFCVAISGFFNNKPWVPLIMAAASYLNPLSGLIVFAAMLCARWSLRDAVAFGLVFFALTCLGLHVRDEVRTEHTCVASRPNWGLHWYVHIEVFESFRVMFCEVLTLLVPGIVLPFAWKVLREEGDNAGLAVAAAYALSIAVAPSPAFAEYCAGLCLLLCAAGPSAVRAMRTPLLVYIWALLITLTLGHCYLIAWLRYQV